jgi:hypothetical protein
MKAELTRRGLAACVVVGVGSGGCGLLNGQSNGTIESPFQQGEGEGEGEASEGEGEGEGEDDNRLTTTPVATPTLSYQPLRTVNGASFELALPEGYASTRYAVIVVSAANPCLRQQLAGSLFDQDMAIVQVPAVSLTSSQLDDVFDSLEHDIGLDDRQTFAITAGEASRLLEDARVGNRVSPGLLLLSPAALPLLDPDKRTAATTIFADNLDVTVNAMQEANNWPVERVDGGVGCGLLDNPLVDGGNVSDRVRALLLAR